LQALPKLISVDSAHFQNITKHRLQVITSTPNTQSQVVNSQTETK
jgi:hypothetical protein